VGTWHAYNVLCILMTYAVGLRHLYMPTSIAVGERHYCL